MVEFVGRLLEKENMQVHCDPPPAVLEYGGGIRRVGFAIDFEADVVVEQPAQIGGYLAQFELRWDRLKASSLGEWYVRLGIACHARNIARIASWNERDCEMDAEDLREETQEARMVRNEIAIGSADVRYRRDFVPGSTCRFWRA